MMTKRIKDYNIIKDMMTTLMNIISIKMIKNINMNLNIMHLVTYLTKNFNNNILA